MDSKTVNTIVEQVLSQLRQGGAAAAVSKPAPSAATQPASPRVGKVFLTADAVQQRIGAAGRGILELGENEFLTPAAKDLLDTRRIKVQKIHAAPAADAAPIAGGRPVTAASACGMSIGLVTEGGEDKVRSAVGAMERDGVALVSFNKTDCSIANLTELCNAISAGSICAGVAILPYAADAMVLANKFRGVRALQATRLESVAAGVRRLGANLLVVEHAVSTYHEMRSMVRRFSERRTAEPTNKALLKAVESLER